MKDSDKKALSLNVGPGQRIHQCRSLVCSSITLRIQVVMPAIHLLLTSRVHNRWRWLCQTQTSSWPQVEQKGMRQTGLDINNSKFKARSDLSCISNSRSTLWIQLVNIDSYYVLSNWMLLLLIWCMICPPQQGTLRRDWFIDSQFRTLSLRDWSCRTVSGRELCMCEHLFISMQMAQIWRFGRVRDERVQWSKRAARGSMQRSHISPCKNTTMQTKQSSTVFCLHSFSFILAKIWYLLQLEAIKSGKLFFLFS